MSLSLLLAAAPAAPAGGLFGGMAVPMILMMVIFYFLLIRPQRKKQKELDDMIGALKSGDRVVTAGGLHGLVTSVKEGTVLIRIAEGVKAEFDKTSIARVLPKDGGDKEVAAEDEK